MLKGNISKDEALEDPDAVLDVLQFESNRTAAKAAPESDTPLPAEKNITLSKTTTAISSSCFLSNSSFLDDFQTIWLARATRRPYTWSQRRLAKGKSHMYWMDVPDRPFCIHTGRLEKSFWHWTLPTGTRRWQSKK